MRVQAFRERSAQPVILVAHPLNLPKAFANDKHTQQFWKCLAKEGVERVTDAYIFWGML